MTDAGYSDGSPTNSRRGNLVRFSQIGRVLVRHGFGFVFDVRRDRREKRGARELLASNFGVKLRQTLDDLGPTFVKFGQLLSTRADIIPQAVLLELQKLQDTVAPIPLEVAQAAIEQELASSVGKLFVEFDPVPLGSASIGQVYKARLYSGEVVAVKVQRPEAPGRVEADLALMKDFAALLDARFGDRIFIDVRELVAEFEGVIRRELDYGTEAENARRFAINFAGTPVRIPKIYTDLSTKRVLTMEFIEGSRFYNLKPLLLAPAERRRVATMGAATIFKMAFEDGFFHGDPHPANLVLTPEGDLALLDFGMVGFLSRGDIEALSRLFVAVIQYDAAAALRGLEGLGIRYSSEVREDLLQELRRFLYRYSGLTVGEVTLGQTLSELISLIRRYRISMPPVFPLLTKALVTAEALSRSIDPTINVYEIARPYASRLIRERYEPQSLLERSQERTLEYARYLEDYPQQIRQVLTALEDGEIEVTLHNRGLDELTEEMDVLANRLVFVMVTAALLVGSSLLEAFPSGDPQVPYIGLHVVSLLGFIMALVMATILLTIIFRSRRL